MAGAEDILGLGKAGEKLIDVVSKGVGGFYKDWVSPSADARRIKMLSAAETEAEHQQVIAQTKTLLKADAIAQRAGKRLIVQEIRRQNNIERVISLAAGQLNSNTTVSEIPVKADWSARFFDIVKDVQDVDVQKIWAKILAGEIVKPGTFSLRTLETMRNITQEEAELFTQKICPFVINGEMIVRTDKKEFLESFGILFQDVMYLRDAGLIMEGDTTVRTFHDIANKNVTLVGKTINLIVRSQREEFAIPAYVLSSAGKELYLIQDCTTNLDYMRALDEYLKKNGFEDVPGTKINEMVK